MSPKKFYVDYILPALAAFKKGYRERDVGLGQDIARGADLANLLLSLPEYIFIESTTLASLIQFKTIRNYRENYAWKSEPCYELTCDFANAWKHRKISRQGKKLSSIADVRESYVICRYRDEGGLYYRGHKIVMLRTNDGRNADLRRVLIASTRFWAKELHRLNLVPQTPADKFDYDEYSPRNDSLVAGPLRIHGIAGEPIHLEGICFDFDEQQQQWIDVVKDTGFYGEITFDLIIHPSPFTE
jgi:hypothetical protein